MSVSVPAKVAGTSIDVLSVSISNRLSPGLTASPADLNHFVILPSATVSPSCGIRTSISKFPKRVPEGASIDAFARDFHRRIRWPQDQAVADEFVATDEIAAVARLDAVR